MEECVIRSRNMSTRVGSYLRERPSVRNYLEMRLKKEVTNSIKEEVMSTYALPNRYNLEGFMHGHRDQRGSYQN